MKSVNFIPSYRVDARQRRRRLNAWIAAGTFYAVVLLGTYACCMGLWGRRMGPVLEDQKKTSLRMQETTRLIRAVHAELATLEQTLKANRAVEHVPDWSLLLAVLPEGIGPQVVLTRCELKPDAPAAAPTAAPAPDAVPADASVPFTLRVTGYGQTAEAVLRFAQELERMELFDQIRLVKTGSEPFLSGSAIAFQMECALNGKADRPK